MLAKQMLVQGVWPDCWRDHWLAPVYKKGAVAKATNYRGVHLTCILSKALERVISEVFVQFLAESGAYGSSQWAFQKERSCRDLVALATLNWILQLHAGLMMGVFLSDISGAFDRVECKLLLEKLEAAGVCSQLLSFLKSYLEPRRARVVVNGARSDEFVLANSVFQGTVLGPPLWNSFFRDVSSVIPKEYVDAKFADDLTCFKEFDRNIENEEIIADLKDCQSRVHQWGD